MDQVWQIIVGLFFVGTGFSIAVGILADHRSAKRDAAWLQVKGKVLTSRVIDDGDGGYIAEVKYEYEVDGMGHTSDRISFGPVLANKRVAKATTERYPAGSLETVNYDPQKPSFSVLDREEDAGINFADIMFALVFGGVGILVMFGLIGD